MGLFHQGYTSGDELSQVTSFQHSLAQQGKIK
jgi:hypothetical protein